MVYVLRHVLSVLILPTTVVGLIPIWIARRYGVEARWPDGPIGWLASAAGLAIGAVGFLLFAASLRLFFTIGRGTLAPWDPPRNLVVRGPYRYVRNPMISGVILMLVAIALVLQSGAHAVWAATFLAANLLWCPLAEEPVLEAKFGDEYRTYKKNVRRFLPRLRAWEP
jgi:protein-S-isoprenylcysteine O-methyltransferase Ste14